MSELSSTNRFVAMPWHQSTLDQYAQLMQNKTLPHAILFYGNAGIGKRAFANALAALVLCQSPQHNRACDQCKTCLLRIAGNHTDYKEVTPEEKGKQIGVDQIRQLNDMVYSKASQTSWIGAYKVILIDPAQMMNTNASNSLLKILEEPASNTIFLLLTDFLQWLLPTVRSRCQQKLLMPPDQQTTLSWLKTQEYEGQNLNEHLLQTLLPYYPQQPRLVLELIISGEHEQRLQMVNYCRQIFDSKQSTQAIQQMAEQISSQKELHEANLAWFYEEVHQYFRRQCMGENGIGNSGQGDQNRSTPLINTDFHAALHQAMKEGRSNVNPKLMWQNLLLQWQQCSP